MNQPLAIVALKCPSCGGKLEIAQDMVEFCCGYCGVSVAVERRGGTVALRAVTDAIARVQQGTDKTAAELAIRRLEQEIKEVQVTRQGWVAHREAKESTIEKGFMVSILLFGMAPTILLLAASGEHQGISAALFLIAAVVYAAVAVVICVRIRGNARRESIPRIDETIARCDAYLQEKSGQLARNRAIADG